MFLLLDNFTDVIAIYFLGPHTTQSGSVSEISLKRVSNPKNKVNPLE